MQITAKRKSKATLPRLTIVADVTREAGNNALSDQAAGSAFLPPAAAFPPLRCRRHRGATAARGSGLGLLADGPETLLGALLGQPVARADLEPGGPGLAGGLDLGGLQFLGRLAQAAGGVEAVIGRSATSNALSAARIRLTVLRGATSKAYSTAGRGQ